MAACTRKLRQERGASVVFALVIFLIVTIFSWTMVNGALTAAQNASMQHKEEQAYLNVTSAARLFCQEATFTAQDIIENIPDGSFPPDWRDVFQNWSSYEAAGAVRSTNPEWAVLGLVQRTFINMQNYVDQHTLADSKEVKRTETLYMYAKKDASDNGFEGFGTVQVKLTMTKTIVQRDVSYSVEARFQNVVDDSDEPNAARSSVSVTFKGMETPPSGLAPGAPIVREMQWSVSGTERGRFTS